MEQEAIPAVPKPVRSGKVKVGTGLEAAVTTMFPVKEEPLDFDLLGKGSKRVMMDEVELKFSVSADAELVGATTTDKTQTTALTATGKIKEEITQGTNPGTGAVPQIGSTNSAFLPYKQQSLTILTNLQRGNVKTTNKETGPESLTFHEKAAKAALLDGDIAENTVNTKDPHGFTPLMWAAFHGRLAIVQRLVERGAVLDCYGPDGETALMFAATNGHTPVLVYLLTQGADVDAEDDAGNTALMFAAYGNYVDCVVQLLRRGGNMNKPNGIGDTPFEIAINKGHHAAQYAMEDFLKEEIEMSLVSAVRDPSQGGTGRINGNSSNNSAINKSIGNTAEVIVISNSSNNKSRVGQILEGGMEMSINLGSVPSRNNASKIIRKGNTSSKHSPS